MRSASLQIYNENRLTEITNSFFSCDIKAKGKARPDSASVEIHNLAENTRDFARLATFADILVNGALMFSGEISSVECRENVTFFEFGRFRGIRDRIVSFSFAEGTTLASCVQKVCDSVGLRNATEMQGVLHKPMALSGKVDRVLRELIGNNWVIGKNGLQQGQQAKTLSYDARSGLVGNPVLTKKGCDFEVLLSPEIEIGCLVKIETQKINGFFRVVEYQHKFNSTGLVWRTEVSAVFA